MKRRRGGSRGKEREGHAEAGEDRDFACGNVMKAREERVKSEVKLEKDAPRKITRVLQRLCNGWYVLRRFGVRWLPCLDMCVVPFGNDLLDLLAPPQTNHTLIRYYYKLEMIFIIIFNDHT